MTIQIDVHVHSASGDGGEVIKDTLAHILAQGKHIMATVKEVKDVVAAEAAEVKGRLDDLQAQIDKLVAAGSGATPAELDEIKAAVEGIFTSVP